MRIGILYICTGRYDIFWKDFYLSSERYFFSGNTDVIRHYYVFTDSKSLFGEEENGYIHRIYQENLGWPDNTLKRFHMFLRIKDRLMEETDYLFFCNANLLFQKPVGKEILPQDNGNGLVGTIHPGFFNKNNEDFTYERNSLSTAYIPGGAGNIYYAGGFSGGRTLEYIRLCENIKNNIDIDESNDYVAIWHDESHINRYFLDNPPMALSPSYLYPEGWKLPFEKKILIRDKKLSGGHDYLRRNDVGTVSISIIVPVYKVEKHIERCLYSVFRQDYEGEMECILVDDCSPDGSMAIADSLLDRYTGRIRFKKLHHERNRGLSAARNSGTLAAEGDYLFYLDSDDEIMPGAISSLVELALKYPGVDVIYGDWYVCRRHNVLQNAPWLQEYIDNKDRIIPTLISDGLVSMTAPNKLIRTEFIRKHSLYFREGISHEDELFNYFMAEALGSIAVSFVPTYVYYLNPNGITSNSYDDGRLQDLMDIVGEIFKKGETYYRYLSCLRLICIICHFIPEDSTLFPRLKELLRMLYRASLADGLYCYSFYLYKCYIVSFRRRRRMTRKKRCGRIFSRTLRKIYRIRGQKGLDV